MLHNRFWQAFFALSPLICVFIALGGYFIFIINLVNQGGNMDFRPGESPMQFIGGLGIFLLLIFLAVFLSICSLVYYIVHAAQNPDLKQNNMLVVWILLFVFANGIGQLIYWILEILNKPKIRN